MDDHGLLTQACQRELPASTGDGPGVCSFPVELDRPCRWFSPRERGGGKIRPFLEATINFACCLGEYANDEDEQTGPDL